MTRETRVGTVVASSFLCLLGIVVASKWDGGEPRGETSNEQEAHPSESKQAPGKDDKAPAIVQAAATEPQQLPPLDPANPPSPLPKAPEVGEAAPKADPPTPSVAANDLQL